MYLPFPIVNNDIIFDFTPYFLSLNFKIFGYSVGFIKSMMPFSHFPFKLPLKSHGIILTDVLFRNLLIFPVFVRVTTKKVLPSVRNHTGVLTAFPLFRYVSRFIYFALLN